MRERRGCRTLLVSRSDDEMKNNTNQVIEKLNKLNVSEIGTTELLTIMRLQSLVNEYKEDAAQD